ncbi:hypothetical protein [Falsibacillus pallidus]|uniref:Uncharacterized protein n=1 Tax=Falsibacillus pallidus TaxID=493781 RepID=A0A370GH59_9BACI|nr:hypothetical protein [Falsibacillus pallidus]RDI41253.1 hypothetical protein DFR59_10999 [Falsibacillus pallidus]
MSQKRDKGNSQKGTVTAGVDIKNTVSAEEVEKVVHPAKDQNSEQ